MSVVKTIAPSPDPVDPLGVTKPAKTLPSPEKPVEKTVPKSALELRAARRRILQRRYGIWVGIPTLLAMIYFLLIATPQYDSNVLLAVESSEGRANDKTANAGNQRDARLLREALRSAAALATLDGFKSHYSEHGDWFNRLASDAGSDTTLSYYRDKVIVTHEAGTNLTSIRVRAFEGNAAHAFGTKLIEFAQGWVAQQNEVSSAARLKQALAEVTRERTHLTTSAAALAKIDQPKPSDPAAIEHEIAEKRLEAALRGLQEAQLEVGRAQRYLVVLNEPSQPDTASMPRRAWGILTVAIGALVLISVLSLLGASVREHAKF